MFIPLIILSLIAGLWLWLVISPAHRVTFRLLLNSDTPLAVSEIDLPHVTVIIPARNEALMLPGTLPSICAQQYPDLRVILIDDQSEDDSPGVLADMKARYPNLTVLSGTPRPAGWMGKSWAVHTGYLQSTSDWVLFTDADVVFHPLAVAQSIKLMIEQKLDMLTLFPRSTFGRMIERFGVAGMLTLLGLLFPVGRANNPRRKTALGIGMFILCRKKAYEQFGGHEAIKHEIIEDMAIARVMKAKGMNVHVRLTSDLLTTRMYDGWPDLWEGLSKNAYASLNYNPIRLLFMLTIGSLIGVFPPFYLLGSMVWVLVAPSPQAWWALGLSIWINLAMAMVYGRTTKYLQLPFLYRFMMSVSTGLYIIIAGRSAWQHHFGGGNVWKGRVYDRQMLTSKSD